MGSQHVKGAISFAKGTVKERFGKLTGDRRLETEGKLQQVQGKAQDGMGDVEDAVRKAGRG
jgi:uncharacterized protein YjbJ (UPF0337 family)